MPYIEHLGIYIYMSAGIFRPSTRFDDLFQSLLHEQPGPETSAAKRDPESHEFQLNRAERSMRALKSYPGPKTQRLRNLKIGRKTPQIRKFVIFQPWIFHEILLLVSGY